MPFGWSNRSSCCCARNAEAASFRSLGHFPPDNDSPRRQFDLFTKLLLLPSRLQNCRCDELGADVAFAEVSFFHEVTRRVHTLGVRVDESSVYHLLGPVRSQSVPEWLMFQQNHQ